MATLAEVGQTLKEAREAQGLSLEEVASRTRIALRHLRAIEEGDETDLPEVFYVRGFLKKYAELVGLSPTEVADAYYKAPTPTPTPSAAKAEIPVGPIAYYVLIIGLIIGSLALAWYFQPHLSVVSEPSPTPTPSPTATPAPALIGPTQVPAAPATAPGSPETSPEASPEAGAETSPESPSAEASPAAGPSATATPSAKPSPTPSAKPSPARSPKPSPKPSAETTPSAPPAADVSVLRLQLNDRAWVKVKVDGRVVYAGLAPKGLVKEFSGHRFEVHSGNAGGVEVSLNGQSQGVLGAPGAVAQRTYE